MAKRPKLSVPTTSALAHGHRIPPNASEVARILTRLSRPALIELALQWLKDINLSYCAPVIESDEDPEETEAISPFHIAGSVEEVREVYKDLQARKGGKSAVLDRILEGDWRHGLSLYQLALAEVRVLVERPNSVRWNASQLTKLDGSAAGGAAEVGSHNVPRLSVPTFLTNLQHEVAPVARAHYFMTRLSAYPISLLRVYFNDSPYNSQKALADAHLPSKLQTDSGNTIFVAFPDGSPYVYVSLISSGATRAGGDVQSLKRFVVDAIPKALSRPQHRYALKSTALNTKSLDLLLTLRGAGRTNNAGGGWSIFSMPTEDSNALNTVLPIRPKAKRTNIHIDGKENDLPGGKSAAYSQLDEQEPDSKKKRRTQVAEGRFGTTGLAEDGKGLERLDIRLEEPFSGSKPPLSNVVGQSEEWRPDIRLSFQGTHVFAGIRRLVEQGVIDGEKMPSWMTGESGVSVGVVRGGRILNSKRPIV